MREISLEEVRAKALQANEQDLHWHFHVLTPQCQYNPKKSYAFALEVPEGNYLSFTAHAPNELGRELAPLAHKADVLNQASTDVNYQPSLAMQQIIARAKALTEQGIEWHHHVTFKGCQFHVGSSNYAFVFEDPERGVTVVPLEQEPINDLKQIEPLFYSQRPAHS